MSGINAHTLFWLNIIPFWESGELASNPKECMYKFKTDISFYLYSFFRWTIDSRKGMARKKTMDSFSKENFNPTC